MYRSVKDRVDIKTMTKTITVMKATFKFKSVGKPFDSTDITEKVFFEFLVGEKLGRLNQCVKKIENMEVTCEALTPEYIFWIYDAIKDGFNTQRGYRYILTDIME